MAEILNNTLHGPDGATPDTTSLANSAKSGTLTYSSEGGESYYDSSKEIRGFTPIRVLTGYDRENGGTEGNGTPRIVWTPPAPPWTLRFYLHTPDMWAAGNGSNEHYWIARLSPSLGLVVRAGSPGTNLQFRLKPNDLSQPLISYTSFSGNASPTNTWVRVELSYDGTDMEIRTYEESGAYQGTYVFESVSLSGDIGLTGYRYKDGVLLVSGSRGSEVTHRQNQLLKWNPGILPNFGADGDFGQETRNAVISFQTAFGISPIDGEIGPETGAALDLMEAVHDGDPLPDPVYYSNVAAIDSVGSVGGAFFDAEVSSSLGVSTRTSHTKGSTPSLEGAITLGGEVGAYARIPFSFPLNIVTEIQPSGMGWVDISSDVRATEDVTVERGRPEEGVEIDASRMTLMLNNRHGRYSPRNPRSPYYGRLGLNTPIRVRIQGPGINPFRPVGQGNADTVASDEFTIDGVDVVSGNALLLGVWCTQDGVGTDMVAPGSMDSVSVTGNYSKFLEGKEIVVHQGRTGSRSAHYEDMSEATYAGAMIALQGQLGVPLLLQHHTDFATADDITITTDEVVSGHLLVAVQAWDWDPDDEMVSPSGEGWSLISDSGVSDSWTPHVKIWVKRVDEEEEGVQSVTFSSGSATDDHYASVWVVDDLSSPRFTGEVSSWPQSWDLSGNDVWTDITASGIIRRLTQGSTPARSPLTRLILGSNPFAYWPLTDPSGSIQAAPAVGPANMRPHNVTRGVLFQGIPDFGQGRIAPWMEDVVQISEGSEGRLVGDIPVDDDSWVFDHIRSGRGGEFRVRVLDNNPATPGRPSHVFQIITDPDADTLKLEVTTNADETSTTTTNTVNNPGIFSNDPHHIRMVADGTSIKVLVNGTEVISRTISHAAAPARLVIAQWFFNDSNATDMALGHFAFWGLENAPTVAEIRDALGGYSGERAGRRIKRICEEEGIDLEFIGDLDETVRMGPQPIEAALDLLQQTADTDGGMLGESRGKVALLYRTGRCHYSQASKVVLDYSASQVGDIVVSDDDQRITNSVTASGEFSGKATVQVEEGPMSTKAPPEGVGEYHKQISVNPYSENQLSELAGWRVYLGTADEARYPELEVKRGTPAIYSDPDLVGQLNSVDFGDIVGVDNLPEWISPEGVRMMIEGYEESFNLYSWDTVFNATPGNVWNVAHVWGHEDVTESFESEEYSITITNGGDAPWLRSDSFYSPHSGFYSLRSGEISSSETSQAHIAVPDGAVWCELYYAVFVRTADDHFRIEVDGTQVLDVNENTPWTKTLRLDVRGASTVTVSMEAGATGSGLVAAQIDDVCFHLDQRGGAEPDEPIRVDSDGSELAEGVDETSTTLLVQVNDGPDWITSDEYEGDFPFDITVGGEKMRVTAISGSSPQVFTVQRSVNGVSKSHSAGDSVRLYRPAYTAL